MQGIGFLARALALTLTVGAVAAALSSAVTVSADTFSGDISDSMCRAKHEAPSEGGPELSNQECTNACVRGGSKYVLVTDDGVLVIQNQDHGGLETHAGASVMVTGDLDGEELVVTTIDTAEN